MIFQFKISLALNNLEKEMMNLAIFEKTDL